MSTAFGQTLSLFPKSARGWARTDSPAASGPVNELVTGIVRTINQENGRAATTMFA